MPSLVLLTDDAAQDLEEMRDSISRHDSFTRANHVLGRIEQAFNGLSESPQRGSYPKELLDIGIREYREVFFKPYRIIWDLYPCLDSSRCRLTPLLGLQRGVHGANGQVRSR